MGRLFAGECATWRHGADAAAAFGFASRPLDPVQLQQHHAECVHRRSDGGAHSDRRGHMQRDSYRVGRSELSACAGDANGRDWAAWRGAPRDHRGHLHAVGASSRPGCPMHDPAGRRGAGLLVVER